jgi:hypothetical protein
MVFMETWLPVAGFEDLYEISNRGRARSLDRIVVTKAGVRKVHRGRLLCPRCLPRGYVYYDLHRQDGSCLRAYAHVLVLENFVGPRPKGAEGCHGPGGISDNSLANLRWDTHQWNMRDMVRDGSCHLSRSVCSKCGGSMDGVEYYPDGHPRRHYCVPCRRDYQREYHRNRRRC